MTRKAQLFISLGSTQAVVCESMLFPDVNFHEVHVLTTEEMGVDMIEEFRASQDIQDLSSVKLTVSRVAGFKDLNSEKDHQLFEEILFRWILKHKDNSIDRFFCLSGGFKTMSASMMKAANLFGAQELFHVLADKLDGGKTGSTKFPCTHEEIITAFKNDGLKWVRLGPEPGWPQLKSLSEDDYPLESEFKSESGPVMLSVKPTSTSLRTKINDIQTESFQIAKSWDKLNQLPFHSLSLWRDVDHYWLNEPLDPENEIDREWVFRLPKIETHCHLGGFATEGPQLDQVRNAAEDPSSLPPIKDIESIPGWPLPDAPIGLNAYCMRGDNNGSILLKEPGCLRMQCRLLYQSLVKDNVVYAEIRCSPANYTTENRSPWEVLTDIRDAFQQCMDNSSPDQKCHINLIIIASRKSEDKDYRSDISRHIALAVTASEHWNKDINDKNKAQVRVCGMDLAGFENPDTRAHYFREEFSAIHRCGVSLTIHAGENDEAEAIWRAVFDLNTRRIGHALSLRDSPDLLRSVIDRKIGIEMCPFANYQIKGYPIAHHSRSKIYPLLEYLKMGALVSVNTDNIGISGASLTDNLLLTARLCPGISRLDILKLIRNGLDMAYVSFGQYNQLLQAIQIQPASCQAL